MNKEELAAAQTAADTKVRSLQKTTGRMPHSKYCELRRLIVISTIDFVLTRRTSQGREFLLIIRHGASLSDQRLILGGKPSIGVTIEDALTWFMLHEAGLDRSQIISCRQSHCQDVFVEDSDSLEGPLPAAHMRMCVHVVEVSTGFEPTSDGSWSDPEWFTEESLSKDILPDLKILLINAGLIEIQ